jgi:hypothetical protein
MMSAESVSKFKNISPSNHDNKKNEMSSSVKFLKYYSELQARSHSPHRPILKKQTNKL